MKWKQKANYYPVGPVILHPYLQFGVFWKKLILSKEEKTKISSSTPVNSYPKNRKQVDQLKEALYENLSKASSYISVCLNACDQEKVGMHDIAQVLEEARHLLSNLNELFDNVTNFMDRAFYKKKA